ncbi:biosynthetic peptidoglycan transglycosylase [Anaerorhabdus furcosa]|uniref:Transglycosylase n=1 Tax=Anaerorhabdus furcosa TaxID=118967 RepID=A0A1T4NEG3_9FIRM|nr:biosynthetic peptidoglycan transglycosylase [Anaerorhabdus furcosa]SJZ77505.1 Transglycosylase [Anaerorhabdus furcosa]
MKLFKRMLLIILILGLAIGGFFTLEGYNRYKEAIKELPLAIAVSNIQSDPTYVSFAEIDSDFVDALIAIEDHRFFERKGVDVVAIGRALVANLVSKEIQQGGSTITQQVAKNIYFSNKPSFTRKIAEVFFVWDLEDHYTKEEIFAMYANIIYYGDGYYGIKQAAKGYFDKAPNDLTLYEATMLAGFPQSPSRFQLSNGYELINKRQSQILNAMVEYGYINNSQREEVLLQQVK